MLISLIWQLLLKKRYITSEHNFSSCGFPIWNLDLLRVQYTIQYTLESILLNGKYFLLENVLSAQSRKRLRGLENWE